MKKEYTQFDWSPQVEEDCRRLVRLAVAEDLDRGHDWTTLALAPADATAADSGELFSDNFQLEDLRQSDCAIQNNVAGVVMLASVSGEATTR